MPQKLPVASDGDKLTPYSSRTRPEDWTLAKLQLAPVNYKITRPQWEHILNISGLG